MKPLHGYFAKALFALLLLQCGNSAFAVTIPEVPLVPELPPDGGVREIIDIDPEEIVPGNMITDTDALETQVQPVVSALSAQLRNIFRGFASPRGGGAGDDGSAFQSVWANYSDTDFENTFSRTAFEGASELLLLGFDFALGENHLLGMALGSERSEIDTAFNNGGLETEGTTVAPYYGWLLSDAWSIDLGLGFSELDTDQFRTPPAELAPVLPAAPVTSATSGERSFATANLNGFWTAGNFSLGARLGYLSTQIDQDAYIESDGTEVDGSSLEFEQSYIGGDIAYGSRSQPFLGVTLKKDLSSEPVVFPSGAQPSDDDDSLLLTAGWRYYGENGVSAILEWNKRDGKDDYSEDSLSFTMRFDFD